MRKGVEGLAALAQNVLRQKPTGGAVFAFRGKRGDRLKLLYFDGQGFCLYYNDLHSYCISLSGSVEGFGVSCIFLLGDDAIDELVPSTALLLR
ncbi:IS66 family insertion sequence element accessory protein TnpB [Rhizobium lentis]|nr:IS66 family insertion sequence element accessory protein TnpB [Rhizobium lentis]